MLSDSPHPIVPQLVKVSPKDRKKGISTRIPSQGFSNLQVLGFPIPTDPLASLLLDNNIKKGNIKLCDHKGPQASSELARVYAKLCVIRLYIYIHVATKGHKV
jgi:hypothetical protein